MKETPRKFGSTIPEMTDTILKYGCRLRDNPPYVLIGKYKSKEKGSMYGILAAANNEFHAHILRREFIKNGDVDVQKTEYHPVQPENEADRFSVEAYKEKMKAVMLARKEKERLENANNQ